MLPGSERPPIRDRIGMDCWTNQIDSSPNFEQFFPSLPASPIGSRIVGKHFQGAFALLPPCHCSSKSNFWSKLNIVGGKVWDVATVDNRNNHSEEKQQKLREPHPNFHLSMISHYSPFFVLHQNLSVQLILTNSLISVCGHRGVASMWTIPLSRHRKQVLQLKCISGVYKDPH